jgi:indolepyruvate ferredoxin oxidoreductase beta subunit
MVKPLGLDDINWEEVIKKVVPEKFIDLNLAAYKAGMAAAEKL